MTKIVITDKLKRELDDFLKQNRKADLVTTYLFFLKILNDGLLTIEELS